MTENEAINELQANIDLPFGFTVSDEVSEIAIQALEEIQQYRAIGTVEELKTMKENGAFTGVELAQIAAMQMRLKGYQQLGTLEQVRKAVEKQKKYETQWVDDMNNPLEPIKLLSALNSEILKLEYRKANKPKEISILDYTVIYALKDCLDRYSDGSEKNGQ